MKKSELRQIIKEEISKVLRENNGSFKGTSINKITVNSIEVDTNTQNISLQKQGELDEFFLEEVIGDIEAYIDDSNLTDETGQPAFDRTRLISDIKFDCDIEIGNTKVRSTISFTADGDIQDVDVDDELYQPVIDYLASKGII
jgi:hypothetical protein